MTRPVWTKAAIALVGALGTWGVTAFEDDRATSSEWFGLLVALATAAGVYAVTNGVSVDSTTSTPEVDDLGAVSVVEGAADRSARAGDPAHPRRRLVRLRDGSTTQDPRLDRLVSFDGRSRNYPITALLDTTTPRSYTWAVPGGVGQVLDQGREGACVGFAWAGERAARPIPRPTTDADALDVYRAAQRIDEWPGEQYSGTSVLAGAKVATERGWLREYRWGFGLEDTLAAISRHGPCVLGIPWYDSMYQAPGGKVVVAGSVVGGHAILARGVSVKRRTVKLRNSWGPDWGIGGDAEISWDDLGRLLAEGGECCVPVLR